MTHYCRGWGEYLKVLQMSSAGIGIYRISRLQAGIHCLVTCTSKWHVSMYNTYFFLLLIFGFGWFLICDGDHLWIMIFLKQINSSSSMLSFKGSPYWMAPEVKYFFLSFSHVVITFEQEHPYINRKTIAICIHYNLRKQTSGYIKTYSGRDKDVLVQK